MHSEFLRYSKDRKTYPEAAKVITRLKTIAANWDQEPDDLSDEEALRILKEKEWISLQRVSKSNEALRDISPLADLSALTGLSLWDNEIESISVLQHLSKLERLGLRGNRIQDLTPLRYLSRLVELEIQDNPIRDLSVLAELSQLKTLEISSNQIISFTAVSSLTSLWELRVHGPCDDLRGLPNLPNLRVLHLDACTSLEGAERFSELRNLYLGSGAVRDLSPISTLKKLTHLNIHSNRVVSLDAIRRLFALRCLIAGSNQICSVEPLTALPFLHKIDLKENPVSMVDVEGFAATLSPWDAEFLELNSPTQPACVLEVVDQERWDFYDSHPFNLCDFDGDRGLLGSEKSWLLDHLESALELDWTREVDFVVPWQSPRARSHTVCLMNTEAARGLRSVIATIQRVLCSTHNEFIIYLQTDHGADDVPEYTVWVYRDRILVTPETAFEIEPLLVS